MLEERADAAAEENSELLIREQSRLRISERRQRIRTNKGVGLVFDQEIHLILNFA